MPRNTAYPYDVGSIYIHIADPQRPNVEVRSIGVVPSFRIGPSVYQFESAEDLRVFIEGLYEEIGKQLEATSCTV